MNCPICHAEMIMDYKFKIENYLIFNLPVIKKGADQKKVKAAFCPSCGKIELYTDIPSSEKE
jgi:Zn-finger nucleic acid-binding protein